MKIVVFGADERLGALVGDQVVDLARADAARRREQSGSSQGPEGGVPSNLAAFIAAGPAALEAAERAVEFARGLGREAGVTMGADAAHVRAPWPGRRIACVGGNYGEHLLGMERNLLGHEAASVEAVVKRAREGGQWGFWKVSHAATGPGDTIPFPRRVRFFDYEGEVAIVIGKQGKDIRADRIQDYVWGVTLANDWSARDGMDSRRPMSYNLPKNFDGCISLGPCIAVGEVDAQAVDVETTVNGDRRQHYNSRDMIFSFAEVLEFLSRDFTFVPGDVICGGTGAGTAADRTRPLPEGERPMDLFLKVGDVVTVSSPQIGSLQNTIVAP